MTVGAWLARAWRPHRTIWPTRDGWWCLGAAMGLGMAAINTGNNLLYLLSSMLLGLVVVSGVLSEQTMRGLALDAVVPGGVHAGAPALFGVVIGNRKRWLPSYSAMVEVLGPRGVERRLYVPRLEPEAERLLSWQATMPRRGRHRLPGIRLTTRFPFGLFLKANRAVLRPEVIVYPAVGPAPLDLLREVAGSGPAAARRRGRGHDLYNLRDYRAGDDPRLIHWPSSAKTQALTVRELEAETARGTRIVLVGAGRADPERLERALSEAASLAVHLLRAGASVELVGPGTFVPIGRGRAHEHRVLEALALYSPPPGASEDPPARREPAAGARREIRVPLG
jgi:uncharacterized protein (DUF58 family)